MKKIYFDNILINISLIIVLLIASARWYINKLFNNVSIPIYFMIFSIFILLFIILYRKKIKKQKLTFIILCIAIFLPSLYKNAYLIDHRYVQFMYYLLVIFYSIILYIVGLKKNNINLVFKYFVIFAILTSTVTWMSFMFPEVYINNFIPLLPDSSRIDTYNLLITTGARAGLTDHYSRNAFFVIMGIVGVFYSNRKRIKKINFILAFFFIITLFLIGKRGHLLFMVLSSIISYFIFYKISIKNIFKFLIIFFILVSISIVSIKFIPGTSNIYDRVFKNETSDISTGRFRLYEKIFNLYEENNRTPIGWGQFSKSTGYFSAAVHNDYIQLYCEVGILGLLLIIGSNIIILLKNIKLAHKYNDRLLLLILFFNIFYLLYSLTGLPHYDIELYITYFLLNNMLYQYFDIIGKEKIKNEKNSA